MKILQTSGDTTEVLIILKRGHIKVKMLTVVVDYFRSNAVDMSLNGKCVSLQHLLSELSALTGQDPEQIVRSQWWKDVRAALWVVKLGS